MAIRNPGRLAQLVALGAPLALLGGAYIGQYGFGLPPCEMCWWQRYPHFAAVVLALASWLRSPGRLFVALAAVAIAVSGIIGAFHAGVEYGWWEGVTACTTSLEAGDANPLDTILRTPLVRCDVAPWTLLGVSLAGWNFLLSTASVLAIVFLLKADRRTVA